MGVLGLAVVNQVFSFFDLKKKTIRDNGISLWPVMLTLAKRVERPRYAKCTKKSELGSTQSS